MIIKHPTDDQIPDLRRLWKQAFGDSDQYLDAFWQTAFSKERCLCAELDGQIAAALYYLDCSCEDKKLAYLYAVATDRNYRRKGLCHRLMDYAHAHLAKQGYAGAVLVPGSADLFRLYEKMGYQPFGGIKETSALGANPGVPLRSITPTEYAALRKKYLPAGSVVQEGQTLAFLQTQLKFYAGDGFVAAAAVLNDHAFVPELLGTVSKEALTAALGVKTATIRTPGATPFAMYLPFENTLAPTYFGFALD